MQRLGIFLLLVTLVACSPSRDMPATGDRDQTELIFNTYHPPHDSLRQVAVEDFSRRIEAESDGRLKITIPSSSLSPASQQYSAVTDGVVDLAVITIYSLRANVHLPSLAELPLNALSAESASMALWDTYQNYFADIGEIGDVEVLTFFVLPPIHYISKARPLETFEDLGGLKIWVAPGSPTEALKLVDAIPVHSEFLQIYEYASKGTVDALMIGPGTVSQASLHDHVAYMTRIPGGMGSVVFAVIMNKASWEALDADQQAAVKRAATGLSQRTGRALDARDQLVLETVGLQINDASDRMMNALRDRVQPMYDQWFREAQDAGLQNARDVMTFYQNRMAEYEQAR